MVPVPVLAYLQFCPIPLLARYITGTAIAWCPHRYWHFGTLSNTRIGTVHYRYWRLMVTVPVLAYLQFCPIPLLAWYITSTAIAWCPYWYWHFGTLVLNQYWHSPLLVLAFNGTCTSNGLYAFMSTTSIGTVHYRYWH
jgi:hypothetical protein